MAESARTFRLFVSSTFSDLKAERYDNDNADTIEQLCRFFDVCAARGLGLAGDW